MIHKIDNRKGIIKSIDLYRGHYIYNVRFGNPKQTVITDKGLFTWHNEPIKYEPYSIIKCAAHELLPYNSTGIYDCKQEQNK